MVTTRNSGAMEERVEGLEKRMMDHSQMLDVILKRLDDMAMHSQQDQTMEPNQEEEDTASQIEDPGRGGQNRENLRYRGDEGRKLEVPTFDGADTNKWLVRVGRFFQVSDILVGKKLDYVVLRLMGEALSRQVLSSIIGVILSSGPNHIEIWVERPYYVCSMNCCNR